jgi:SsrA-binding protein
MKTLAKNRKVEYEYFVEESEEVGIVLAGWEVKGILSGKMSIAESYVKIIGGELVLIGSNVEPTNAFKLDAVDPSRTRKLLATRKQINKYSGLVSRDGYTLILKDVFYSDNKKIKATLCICKGKKQRDKKEAIKTRDIERDNRRDLSNHLTNL